MPPPGTIMWTWGWWVIAEPHVWSTAVMPMRAPRCLGSAAMVSIVSDAALNSSYAMTATSAGSVNTTWKYPTGSRSASRSASHVRAAAP
jgi:hypothetical protein